MIAKLSIGASLLAVIALRSAMGQPPPPPTPPTPPPSSAPADSTAPMTKAPEAPAVSEPPATVPGEGARSDVAIITLNIQVKSYDDKPLADVPFVVVTSKGRSASKTEKDGAKTVTAGIQRGDSRLDIQIFPGGGADGNVPEWDDQQRIKLINNMRTLSQQYFFVRRNPVKLDPGQSEYNVTITGWPTVTISGYVIGDGNTPLRSASIFSDSIIHVATGSGARKFQLPGVRKGAATTLFIATRPLVVPVFLTEKQTAADTDIGKIVVQQYRQDAGIDPTILNSQQLVDQRVYKYREGLTLISLDGSTIFGFDASPIKSLPNALSLELNGGEFWRVPRGEYFVVPGVFTRTEEQVAVVEMLRAKRDLKASKIPRVKLAIGKVTEFQFDAVAAHAAIRELIDGEASLPTAKQTVIVDEMPKTDR